MEKGILLFFQTVNKQKLNNKRRDHLLEVLKPTFYYAHYTNLTSQWLKEHKVKFILADLDGTLAPQDEEAGEEFETWLQEIQQAGIGLIIVSNNSQQRVDEFVAKHKIVGLGVCKKPSTKQIEEKFFYQGLRPETTLFLGDQLFTDVWCGNQLGLKTVLVDSIPGKEDTFRKIKRTLETYLLKRWNMK